MNGVSKAANASVSILLASALLSFSACKDSPDQLGRSNHDHGDHAHRGDHLEVEVEADDTTLDAVMADKAGQTLPYFNTESFTPLWLEAGSEDLRAFHRIPEFTFVNQDGDTVSRLSYDDTIYVATFFFATCPGICSPINERLLTVQDAISGMDDVRILSHSITPEIDTVDVLRAYANERGVDSSTWDLVTGDRDRIYAVAKEGYFASEDMGEGEAKGDFKHTENILLVDRNGMIRGIYNGLSRNAILNLIADIELLREEQPQA